MMQIPHRKPPQFLFKALFVPSSCPSREPFPTPPPLRVRDIHNLIKIWTREVMMKPAVEVSVTRVARRQHAIKHVYPPLYVRDDLLRLCATHKIARRICGQKRHERIKRADSVFKRFANG